MEGKKIVIKQVNKNWSDLKTLFTEIKVMQNLKDVSGLQKVLGAWPDQLALIS